MEIYLSSETEGRADSLLLPIRNMVDSLLDDIEYSRAAEPPVQYGVSHLSRRTEPHCL